MAAYFLHPCIWPIGCAESRLISMPAAMMLYSPVIGVLFSCFAWRSVHSMVPAPPFTSQAETTSTSFEFAKTTSVHPAAMIVRKPVRGDLPRPNKLCKVTPTKICLCSVRSDNSSRIALRSLQTKVDDINMALTQSVSDLNATYFYALNQFTDQSKAFSLDVKNQMKAMNSEKESRRRFERKFDFLKENMNVLEKVYSKFMVETRNNITEVSKSAYENLLEVVNLDKKIELLEVNYDKTSSVLKELGKLDRISKQLGKYTEQLDKGRNLVNSESGFKPKDCNDIARRGNEMSGVYEIWPLAPEVTTMQVYCRISEGRGWLVLQRRQDGLVSFHQTWSSYEFGFGTLYGDFWLGNFYIHLLTVHQPYQLRVELVDYNNNVKVVHYNKFAVESREADYRLRIGGRVERPTEFDPMKEHNGRRFYAPGGCNNECANNYLSGWWFTSPESCVKANLNGQYLTDGESNWPQSNFLLSSLNRKISWLEAERDELSVFKRVSMEISELQY